MRYIEVNQGDKGGVFAEYLY